MLRRPPRSTRTDTLFPYTTLFRSVQHHRRRLVDIPILQLAEIAVRDGAVRQALDFPEREAARLAHFLQKPPAISSLLIDCPFIGHNSPILVFGDPETRRRCYICQAHLSPLHNLALIRQSSTTAAALVPRSRRICLRQPPNTP